MVNPVLKMRPHPAAHSHYALASYEEVPPSPPVRFKPQAEGIDEALADAVESLDLCKSNMTTMHLLNPRSTPGSSCWGCAARLSNSLLYFRPKNVIFHTRFQTWPPRNDVIIT